MLTSQENDLLCRVEGDAPMGRMMRSSYWIPACLSEEVEEPDGTPLRVKLLGRMVAIFRDSDGRLGALDDRCPHRQASLAYGRNEEGGLRCLYHGWKFDIHGNCLDMSSEPPGSTLKDKVKQPAYPVEEAGGFVWIWMGDPDRVAKFERPAFAPTENARVSIVKMHIRANWAQILEGAIDSAHSSSLHSTDMKPARVDSAKAKEKNWLRPSTDKAPRLQVQEEPWGFRYAAIRRPIFNANTHDYFRITLFVAPFTVLIPPNDQYNVANVNVPMDDENTWFYFIAWKPEGDCIGTEAWRKFNGAQPGIDLDEAWRPYRREENRHLQDRKAMKLGDFTGIRGIPMQDLAMWETMGPLVDRSNDVLGASDLAVVEFRRQMLKAVREFGAGKPAPGTAEPRVPQTTLRSYEGVAPNTTDWRTLGVEPTGETATEPVSA
jgi:phthalate 4,5-dioxygenase oxygenase subunit